MAKKQDEFVYIWSDKKRTIFGLPISFTRYFLTESKLITRSGFLNIEEDELELYRVTDKKLQMSFWQRLFRCGTLVLHVKDTDTPIKIIQSVKAPRTVSELIDKQINLQRDKYNIRGRDMTGSYQNDDCDCDHDEA